MTGVASPPAESTLEDRRLARWPHLCGLVLPVLPAALLRYTVGQRRTFVGYNAAQALNFQIIAWGVIVVLVSFSPPVGSWRYLLAGVAYVGNALLSLRAAAAAGRGQRWRYPVSAGLSNEPSQ
jgi:uncharacterized membrane protein